MRANVRDSRRCRDAAEQLACAALLDECEIVEVDADECVYPPVAGGRNPYAASAGLYYIYHDSQPKAA